MKVTLGLLTVDLVKPSPLFVTSILRTKEQMEAMDTGEFYALGAAALAESWPKDLAWPVQPRPRPWKAGMKSLALGQEVFDGLANGGIDFNELINACSSARTHATSSIVTAQEVEAAKDFCEAPQGALPVTGSTSAENTDSPRTGG